jgi:subtilisin family serine protease
LHRGESPCELFWPAERSSRRNDPEIKTGDGKTAQQYSEAVRKIDAPPARINLIVDYNGRLGVHFRIRPVNLSQPFSSLSVKASQLMCLSRSIVGAVLLLLTNWHGLSLSAAEPASSRPSDARQPQRMNPSGRITPGEAKALAQARSGRPEPSAEGAVRQAAVWYVVHNVEFKDAEACKQFKIEGVNVFNRFDRFADVFIVAGDSPQKVVDQIHAAPGFLWEEFSGSAQAPPPLIGAQGTSRAVPEQIVSGGIDDLQGQGVIVAIVDTGLDFFNPDFITYDKAGQPTSRLRYFWDTVSESGALSGFGSPAPVSYPNGSPIGTVFSRDELNTALRSTKPLFSVWDIDGHGTACAGVAAGNGNNLGGRYQGVAPKAELIGVRLGDNLESAYLLNAICSWIDKVAGDTPVVISCSFGGKDSGHDGMRIEERQLDARFPLSSKGRALCIAAGNDGGYGMHAELAFGGKQDPGTLRWTATAPGTLAVFYDTAAEKDLRYVAGGDLELRESGSVNALSGKYVSRLVVPAGQGEVRFYTESGDKVEADAYLLGFGSAGAARFDASCASYNKLIETPGSTRHAITVGSYDWNDQFERHGQLAAFGDPLRDEPLTIGALSGYSSTGPLRIADAIKADVIKPDIVAPGQYFSAAAARNAPATRDSSNRYTLFNGTSAATPYTAGVLALVMQKKPTITLGEIKQLLQKCGSHDRFTGQVPNAKWGNGKLDLRAVEKMLESLAK